MKVLIVLCAIVVATQANPAFRALRARASGLGAGGSAPAAPQLSATGPSQPVAQPQQPLFQPVGAYQPQQFQAQPQYQQFRPPATSFGNFPGVPFGGYQQMQG